MPTKINQNEEIQIVDYRYDEGIRGRKETNISSTITTKSSGFSGMPMVAKMIGGGCKMNNLRIRKLIPKECLKLMGFSEKDWESVKDEFSDSAIYHVAGDSIITCCLVALFGTMTDINYRKTISDYVETLKGDYE